MSDIPVGSPPVPPGRHAAPGGWYADPVDPARERYWDGWQWSRNTRPREGGAPPPAYAAPAGPYAPPGSAPGAPPAYPPAPGHPPAPAYGYPAGGARVVATTADGVPLAGWWWRVLATLIDNLLLFIVISIVSIPLWRPLYDAMVISFEEALEAGRTGGQPPPPFDPQTVLSRGDQAILVVVTIGIALAYHVVFLRWKGATVGKLATGLRVVPADRGRDRTPLDWGTIARRAAIWVVPANIYLPLALFTLVDALFPLWQPKRQALHDLAAKTQVVRIR